MTANQTLHKINERSPLSPNMIKNINSIVFGSMDVSDQPKNTPVEGTETLSNDINELQEVLLMSLNQQMTLGLYDSIKKWVEEDCWDAAARNKRSLIIMILEWIIESTIISLLNCRILFPL